MPPSAAAEDDDEDDEEVEDSEGGDDGCRPYAAMSLSRLSRSYTSLTPLS